MRDSQRQKLYNWENSVVRKIIPDYSNPLTTDDCKLLIDRVARSYKIPVPEVLITRADSGKSYYRHGTHSVHLAGWGHTYGTVLHEIAHAIANKTLPEDGGHGPNYVKVYCELMSRMFELPLGSMRRSACDFGLKISQ
jgi:hypothetical protein